jgi:hypothetical protein
MQDPLTLPEQLPALTTTEQPKPKQTVREVQTQLNLIVSNVETEFDLIEQRLLTLLKKRVGKP